VSRSKSPAVRWLLCHRRCARTMSLLSSTATEVHPPIKGPQCGLRPESGRGTTLGCQEVRFCPKCRNTGTLRTVTETSRWTVALGAHRGSTTVRLLASQLGIVGCTLSSAGDATGLGGVAEFRRQFPSRPRFYRSRCAPSRSKCWERIGISPSLWSKFIFVVGAAPGSGAG